MLKFRTTAILASLIAAGSLQASEAGERWFYAGATTDGDDYYIDKRSAELTSDFEVRIWVRVDQASRQRWGGTELWSTSYKALTLYHCRSRAYTNEYVAVFDGAQLRYSSRVAGPGREPVLPDTVQEKLYDLACSGEFRGLDAAADAAAEASAPNAP